MHYGIWKCYQSTSKARQSTAASHSGMVQDVQGLQAEGVGDPDKIPKRQHDAKAFPGDVHPGLACMM